MASENVKKVLALLLLGREKEAKKIKLNDTEIKLLGDLLREKIPKEKKKKPKPILFRRRKTNISIAFNIVNYKQNLGHKKRFSSYKFSGKDILDQVSEFAESKSKKSKSKKGKLKADLLPQDYLESKDYVGYIERFVEKFTRQEATKFGRNLGIAAREYIERYGGEGKGYLARDCIAGIYGPIMQQEGGRYIAYAYKSWGERERKLDSGDKKILYGNRKMFIGKDDPIIKSIESIIEMRPKGDVLKGRKLLETRKKQLSVPLKAAVALIERGETLERLEKKINKDDVSAILDQLTLSMIMNVHSDIEDFGKKFVKEFGDVDPFYVIGRGDEEMSYGSLIEGIVTNPNPDFEPSNLSYLAASGKFKDAFFMNVVDLGGEDVAVKWFVEKVLKGGVAKKPVTKYYLSKLRASKPKSSDVELNMTADQLKGSLHEVATTGKKIKDDSNTNEDT